MAQNKKKQLEPDDSIINPQKAFLIYCAVPDESTGEKISKHLLSLQLIACANLFPQVRSFYEWEGKFQNTKESVLIFKTTKKLYPQVEKELIKIHPYECPGLCAFSIKKGYEPFLLWIKNQCKG